MRTKGFCSFLLISLLAIFLANLGQPAAPLIFFPHLYNTCILQIFLYWPECWAVTKVDACRIDAVDQWCLRTLLEIKWRQSPRNEEVRRITKQPNLTEIIQSRRLSIFAHIARMDDDPMRPESLQPHTEGSNVPTEWNALCGGWCLCMATRLSSTVDWIAATAYWLVLAINC